MSFLSNLLPSKLQAQKVTLIHPLSTLIIIALRNFAPEGTLISVNNHCISLDFSDPRLPIQIKQSLARSWKKAEREDLTLIQIPIQKATIWYNRSHPAIALIFDLAIQSLQNLHNLYKNKSKDSSKPDTVCNTIQLQILCIQEADSKLASKLYHGKNMSVAVPIEEEKKETPDHLDTSLEIKSTLKLPKYYNTEARNEELNSPKENKRERLHHFDNFIDIYSEEELEVIRSLLVMLQNYKKD
jgi:hypothetical protein